MHNYKKPEFDTPQDNFRPVTHSPEKHPARSDNKISDYENSLLYGLDSEHSLFNTKQSQYRKTAPDKLRRKLISLSQNRKWKQLVQFTQDYWDKKPISLVYRAWALVNLGNPGGAHELIRSCINDCKLLPEAQFVYAVILMHLDYRDGAGLALRNAINLEQNFPEAYYLLGILQLRMKMPESCLESLEIALSLMSGSDPEEIFLLSLNRDTIHSFSKNLVNELVIYTDTLLRNNSGSELFLPIESGYVSN